MKALQRIFSAALTLAILVAQPVAATSLYRGLKAAPRPTLGVATAILAPQLPLSLGAAAALAPAATFSPAGSALIPTLSAPLPAAAAQALPQAQSQASAESSGAAPARSAAELNAAFDGTRGAGDGGIPPSAAPTATDPFDRFVALAKTLFHPTLPAGTEPSVAASAAKRAQPDGSIPSDDEMVARMRLSPLTNPQREDAVIKLYQVGGAAASVAQVPRGQAPDLALHDTVQRQDVGRGRNNLIVVKKGSGHRIVVVGAHHDKVSEGAGTIDNWTGSTMLTNLYQAMNGVDTETTFMFVAFAREEEGLIGSEEFLRSLPKAQRDRIDSMINLDTLAVDGTFSWRNNSTKSLLTLVKQVAARESLDLVETDLNGGDSDSSPFRRAGIAAMTIFGASDAVIWDIIHSARDNMAAFSLPHYRNAYLLTLALLKSLDLNPVKTPSAA